jgi:hypothetical protein
MVGVMILELWIGKGIKEAVGVYFKVLLQHLFRWTEESREKWHYKPRPRNPDCTNVLVSIIMKQLSATNRDVYSNINAMQWVACFKL